jgi:hypothetical protein
VNLVESSGGLNDSRERRQANPTIENSDRTSSERRMFRGRPDQQMFRAPRQLILRVPYAAIVFIFGTAIVISVVQDQPSVALPISLLAGIPALFAAVAGVRLFWAMSLAIEQTELVYRTMWATKRIPRSQILDIDIRQVNHGSGTTKPWLPYLELTDGSTMELVALVASNQSSLDEPDHYGPQAQRMLAAVHAWLEQTPARPRPTLSPPPLTPSRSTSKHIWIWQAAASAVFVIGVLLFRIQSHSGTRIEPLGIILAAVGFVGTTFLTVRFRIQMRRHKNEDAKRP